MKVGKTLNMATLSRVSHLRSLPMLALSYPPYELVPVGRTWESPTCVGRSKIQVVYSILFSRLAYDPCSTKLGLLS